MAKPRIYILDMSAEQLVEFLDKQYPDQCIQPNESPESAHRRGGMRDLISYLKTRLKNEKEKYAVTTQSTL